MSNVITLQQAIDSGATAASIREVAEWNGRRTKWHPRFAKQAAALHRVADGLEAGERLGRAA